MEFQIFQDLPQRLVEVPEEHLDHVLSATYSWTLCLYGNQAQALWIHTFSAKLVRALNEDSSAENLKSLLNAEILSLRTSLPRGVLINGIASVSVDKSLGRSPSWNLFQTVFEELKQGCEVFTKDCAIFLLKDSFKPYQQEIDLECFNLKGEKQKVSALKHSSVNDVLKNYYQLATYFTCEEGVNPLETVVFAKVNNEHIFLPKGSPSILQIEPAEEESKPTSKSSKKPNKSTQNQVENVESMHDKIGKIIVTLKGEGKKTLEEIGKGIALIKVAQIEVRIVSRQTKQAELPKTLCVSNKSTQKMRHFDCVSYVRMDSADHNQELQNHMDFLFETISHTEKNRSVYAFGLLDSPLIAQAEVVLDDFSEIDSESNMLLHYSNLIRNTFASFRRSDRLLITKQIDFFKKGKIRNAHKFMPLKAVVGARRYLVQGNYIYHHYMQDNFNDDGWGCAYRSLQSVLSWFIENHYADEFAIPTHREMQSILVAMGDKPNTFIGTQEWIGAFEVQYIMNKLLRCECKMLYVQSGSDVPSKIEEFKQHFITQGTPVMFGGGVKAFTLMGVDHNEDTGDMRFLIMDPHYTGSDNPSKAVEKGGLSWQNSDLFLSGHFYNFCMPQRPV